MQKIIVTLLLAMLFIPTMAQENVINEKKENVTPTWMTWWEQSLLQQLLLLPILTPISVRASINRKSEPLNISGVF